MSLYNDGALGSELFYMPPQQGMKMLYMKVDIAVIVKLQNIETRLPKILKDSEDQMILHKILNLLSYAMHCLLLSFVKI